MTHIQALDQLTVPDHTLVLGWLGQMGVVIRGAEGSIVIDACLTDVVAERAGAFWQRAFEPPIAPDALRNVRAYLITHEHLDHFDPLTLQAVASNSPDMHIVAPGWCLSDLLRLGFARERITVPEVMRPLAVPGTSAEVTAIAAAHYALEHDPERGHRWLGYQIAWGGVRFFHAGDTIIYPGYLDTLRSLPLADAVLLPINGRDVFRESDEDIFGNLWPREAARLAQEIGWPLLLVGHNDMYVNNCLPMGSVVAAFEQIAPAQPFKIMRPGELLYLHPSPRPAGQG